MLIPAIALCAVRWFLPDAKKPPRGDERLNANERFRAFSAIRSDLQYVGRLVRTALREPGDARESCSRFVICFATAVTAGFLLSLAYNDLRFGSFFEDHNHAFRPQFPPVFGNPLSGFATLILSPGKSVFLYSPPIILGLIGLPYLRRTRREIALATVAASAILVGFISCIAFVGGDWCWGPRYLVAILPLWALAFPFVFTRSKAIRRDVVLAIVGLGLIVQVLALSVENQRFFFERGLGDFFWAEDPWFYFKHSALFARVGEALSLGQPLPVNARFFNSIPIPDWSTYAILGPPPTVPRNMAPQWIQNFKIYYLPRPWPLWMSWIKPGLRPINLLAWVTVLAGMAVIGLGLIYSGLQSGTTEYMAELKLEQETG
jgi:hypothetical protein